MALKIRTQDAAAALRKLIQENVKGAAGNNRIVSKMEAKKLDPFVARAEQELRSTVGGRISVDALVERACTDAQAVWARFNSTSPQDALYLSKAEVRQVKQADPQLGALTERAVSTLQSSSDPVDLEQAARDLLTGYDFSERRLHQQSLPGGRRLDARQGMAGRQGLPAKVLEAFDFYYRVEGADWGSTSLHQGKLGGEDLFAIYQTTDGDEAWVELLKADGAPLASGRLWCDQLLTLDEFPGRGRLSSTFTTSFGEVRRAEGYSEPAERAAAGQIPLDWTAEVALSSGQVNHRDGRLTTLALPPDLTAQQRELATASLDLVWEHVLQHRAQAGTPLELGPRGAGQLRVGSFLCPTDGKTYQVADWRDIDDSSFTFYFRQTDVGLQLAIEQFNN